MRVLIASFPAALLLLSACGGPAPARAAAVDTECLQGAPFARAASGLYARDEPQLSALSDRLAGAHTLADSQAVFSLVAQLLAEEEGDLRALRAPPDDSDVLQAEVAADEAMRGEAERMSQDGAAAMAADRPAFAQAAQARSQAMRALMLRAEFVQGECGS